MTRQRKRSSRVFRRFTEVVLLQYVRSRAVDEGTLHSGQRRRHAQRRVPRALATCRQRSRQPHQQVTQRRHAHRDVGAPRQPTQHPGRRQTSLLPRKSSTGL